MPEKVAMAEELSYHEVVDSEPHVIFIGHQHLTLGGLPGYS
jgi:hypothetical protein